MWISRRGEIIRQRSFFKGLDFFAYRSYISCVCGLFIDIQYVLPNWSWRSEAHDRSKNSAFENKKTVREEQHIIIVIIKGDKSHAFTRDQNLLLKNLFFSAVKWHSSFFFKLGEEKLIERQLLLLLVVCSYNIYFFQGCKQLGKNTTQQ